MTSLQTISAKLKFIHADHSLNRFRAIENQANLMLLVLHRNLTPRHHLETGADGVANLLVLGLLKRALVILGALLQYMLLIQVDCLVQFICSCEF